MMQILYEYFNEEEISDALGLKKYLHNVWQEKAEVFVGDLSDEIILSEESKLTKYYQPFLNFDGDYVRANNYVGFIQNDNLHLEIYPKVFRKTLIAPSLMMRHIFYWFDYCRKWKLPFTKSDLDTIDDLDFPEMLLYLMASKLLKTVSELPISLYQNVEESLYTPKGNLNFHRYLNNGFLTGNHQILECDYAPFVFDNNLNRVIKYISRLLLSKTKFSGTEKMLQELIFILDDVTDQNCTIHDLSSINLNPLFETYEDVMDICKIILQQLLYSNERNELSQWSLLFPMEYIFEDFIAGFIEDKFSSSWKVEYQKSEMYLCSQPAAFQMRHDILLTLRSNNAVKIILDTKYKLREEQDKKDNKKGVDQNDLYQMTGYALRRGCTEVILLYPNCTETLALSDKFIIESGFESKDRIKITAVEIPFWSASNFNGLEQSLFNSLADLLKTFE